MNKTDLIFKLSLCSFGLALLTIIFGLLFVKELMFLVFGFLFIGWALNLVGTNYNKIEAKLKKNKT